MGAESVGDLIEGLEHQESAESLKASAMLSGPLQTTGGAHWALAGVAQWAERWPAN